MLEPGARGNRFQLHDDHPNFYDAWDVDSSHFESVDRPHRRSRRSRSSRRGRCAARVRFVRRFGASTITQVVRLAAGSRRLDFDTDVDWHESTPLLKVAFPVDVPLGRATYEIQFGHLERPTHENTTWDEARFEVCAHRWADLSEPGYGVALLNDCKYGYDVHGNVMRLSLLRAPTWPDPDADRGRTASRTRSSPTPAASPRVGSSRRPASSTNPSASSASRTHPGPRPSTASLVL